MTLLLPIFLFLLLQEPVKVTIDAEYVRVPVTVLDKEGRTVADLKKEELTLFDEGNPTPIKNFVLDQTPVHVVLLLDASGSVKEELEQIKYAAIRFAQYFDKRDRIAVIAFSDGVQVLQNWTNDHKKLRKSLKKLERGYRTAMWDALLSTAQEKLNKVQGKKVIILLTDGLDNESESNSSSVLDSLIKSNTSLYVVSRTRLVKSKIASSNRVEFLDRVMKNVLHDDESSVDIYFKKKEASMDHLARTSGGRVLYPQELRALGKTYMQIAGELKTQYVLTFLPPVSSEKDFRQIEVECSRDIGQIYHREIYRMP
jgi:Ca-activated chloride channel family protein